MKYLDITNNYLFREFNCGLTQEQTARLCFVGLAQVKLWDAGETIPPHYKRLMRMYSNRELGIGESWKQFEFVSEKMKIPTGQLVSAQQILTGLALIEINSELEIKTTSKLLKYARAIANIKQS